MTNKEVITNLTTLCVERQLHPTELEPLVKWFITQFGLEETPSFYVLGTQRTLWETHSGGYLGN